VVSGTANEHAAVELELIGADEKSLAMFLLNHNVEFDVRESTARGNQRHPRQATRGHLIYAFEADGVPVEISLYDSHAVRQQHVPRDSMRHERIQYAEAVRLFA
jgi:hypothetical protein